MFKLKKIAPEPKKLYNCCTSVNLEEGPDKKEHFNRVNDWLNSRLIYTQLKSSKYGAAIYYKLTAEELCELQNFLGSGKVIMI